LTLNLGTAMAFACAIATQLGLLCKHRGATLRAFFEHDLHVEDTARALHVHPNTLHNRLRRYEEATGASLRRQADLVEMWWALERLRLG
jgi:DNA-binding PucR family transcriptional regulator